MAFSGPCSTPEAGSAPGGDRGQGAGVSAELRTYAHGWMTRRTIENLLCRKCSGRAMLCAFVMNGRATCDPYTWIWNAVEGGFKPPNGDQADTRSVKSQVTLAKCARNTCDKGADGTPGTRCKRAPDPSITLAHPSAGWGSSMASRYTRARVGGARRGGDARGRPHHRHGARRGPSLSQVFRPFVTVRSFHERPGHL